MRPTAAIAQVGQQVEEPQGGDAEPGAQLANRLHRAILAGKPDITRATHHHQPEHREQRDERGPPEQEPRTEEAVVGVGASLTLAHELSHPYSLACARYRVGLYQQFLGQAHAAQEQAEATIALAMEKGFAFFVAVGIALKGRALSMQGYGPEGLAYIRQGLTALQATGATPGAHWLVLQAEACRQVGQTAEGFQMLAEALACMHTTGEQNYAAELYRLKGEFLLSLAPDNQPVAETCFHQSLAIAHRQHAKLLELRAAISLTRLWQQQGKRIEAYELLTPIYGWFTEGFDTVDLQEAKALLKELGGG